MSPIRNLMAKSYEQDRPLNILSEFVDGQFELALSRLGHNIYGSDKMSVLNWRPCTKSLPQNIHISPSVFSTTMHTIPFDLLICHNRLDGSLIERLSMGLHIPTIVVDHFTFPPEHTDSINPYNKHTNICVDDTVKFNDNSITIPYGVDIPDTVAEKTVDVLIAGKFHTGDYDIFPLVGREFDNHLFVGPNQGVSEELYDEEYNEAFGKSKVYVNLTSNMGVPYELLKAMAAGCAIITNRTPVLEKVLGDSVVYAKSKYEITTAVKELLNKPSDLKKYSEAARELVKDKFSMDKFLSSWDSLIAETKHRIFLA